MNIKEVRKVYSNPEVSAKIAGLKYITDSAPGISRVKNGKSFVYYSPEGKKINAEEVLERIKKLVIPPAWQDVWVSPIASGHLQVTGKDARGRKQYKYHADWTSLRNLTKFDRLIFFAKRLPDIRKTNRKNLKLPGMPKNKALAVIVELLDKVFIRIGNEEYKKTNQTYGLTTLRDKHVKIKKDEIEFKFIAKSGKESNITLKDKLLAKLVKKCREIPGYHLFQYFDENGSNVEIHSQDVNSYLKEITGEDFTAKDFRTWAGTVNAYNILKDCVECSTEKDRKKAVVSCIKEVAQMLNNTVAICRKYYIHPRVIDAFADSTLYNYGNSLKGKASPYFSKSEEAVLKLLKSSSS